MALGKVINPRMNGGDVNGFPGAGSPYGWIQRTELCRREGTHCFRVRVLES